MAITLETYQVVAPAGVVIEDGESSILYQAGMVFKCRPRCHSVVHHLAAKNIVVSDGPAIAPPTGPVAGGVGPIGPQGRKGSAGDRGEKGDPGPQGEVGPQGLTWRGIWNPITAYSTNDGVSYLGSSFIAVSPNLNDPPLSPNWSVLASRGGDGFEGRKDAAGLTDKWLSLKARLESVPPSSGEDDPYAGVRIRLSSAVQAALDAVLAAGGPA
jgi:hypothetical protein